MRVLITGAAGFIGANLMERLQNQGIEVLGVDNFSKYYNPEMKTSHISTNNLTSKIYEIDVCDGDRVNKLFNNFRPTHVVHLAAQGGVRASKVNPTPYIQTNQSGFLNTLLASESIGAEKFLYASSSSVYGDSLEAPFMEDQILSSPKSLYALSKVSNELMAKYLPINDSHRIGFRFFTVYGPWGRPDMAIFRILASSRLKVKFNLTADLNVMRDFTFVNDVSDVICGALQLSSAKKQSEIFNVAGGSPYTLAQLFKVIEEMNIPIELDIGRQDPLDVRMTHGSIAKLLANQLPLPTTTLEDGIRSTWDWIQDIELDRLKAWFDYSI